MTITTNKTYVEHVPPDKHCNAVLCTEDGEVITGKLRLHLGFGETEHDTIFSAKSYGHFRALVERLEELAKAGRAVLKQYDKDRAYDTSTGND